jgi:phosphatidylserine decarboxylase
MGIRSEVIPFLVWTVAVVGLVLLGLSRFGSHRPWLLAACAGAGLVAVGYFLYFFRDPERRPPEDPGVIVAAADGTIAQVTTFAQDDFIALAKGSGLAEAQIGLLGALLDGDVVRISIFLSLFDVHVNRAPMGGESRFLGYFPGKHFFTFQEKSSNENQHNAILIRNDKTACLLHQIVGPVCRRVVYWPDHQHPAAVKMGERIGMMKFGSRLDVYFPAGTIDVVTEEGAAVRAGETVIARIRTETGS